MGSSTSTNPEFPNFPSTQMLQMLQMLQVWSSLKTLAALHRFKLPDAASTPLRHLKFLKSPFRVFRAFRLLGLFGCSLGEVGVYCRALHWCDGSCCGFFGGEKGECGQHHCRFLWVDFGMFIWDLGVRWKNRLSLAHSLYSLYAS